MLCSSRISLSSASRADGADDEEKQVMRNLMTDIQSGFVQRRLPDGGFKVRTSAHYIYWQSSGRAIFQQQYSPMVMRKFRKSTDQGGGSLDEAIALSAASVNSPKLSRKLRNGSLSDGLNAAASSPAAAAGTEDMGPGSPSLRRRRSRIPSEEDDKLINFLVTSGYDGSRERNLSVGNLALASEANQNYGSLDRGLLRRSRGPTTAQKSQTEKYVLNQVFEEIE
jgi:hypothetical protein